MNRHERKRQLNAELSVLLTFVPIQDCQIFRVDRTIPILVLSRLIDLARITNRYTVDTEKDIVKHQPALIQIDFLGTKSIVLIIQVCHLPHPASSLFWMLKALFKAMFSLSNRFYAWGSVKQELVDFIPCGLLSSELLDQVNDSVDVQKEFKGWYNRTFTHDCHLSSMEIVNDHSSCTCPHRPMKKQNQPWSSQRAVAYTFREFLDKTHTQSRWARSLPHGNVRCSDILRKEQKSLLSQFLLYVIDDCSSVTKLSMVIESNWSKEHLRQFNQQQHPVL